MKGRALAIFFGVIALISYSRSSGAWDGVVTGKIVTIDVTNAGNFAFRVYLQGNPAICSTHTWAYLDDTNANYKVYVSALLMAKATGSNVTLYTNIDSGYGFCRIGYIVVQ